LRSGVTSRGDPREQPAPDLFARDGEPAPLGVREPEAARPEHLAQDAVLFPEVLDRELLVAVEPAGEDNGQDVDRRRKCRSGHRWL
jgi:hypothetical protein